eukprot:3815476-Pyramimonas_sp.AAC.1
MAWIHWRTHSNDVPTARSLCTGCRVSERCGPRLDVRQMRLNCSSTDKLVELYSEQRNSLLA